MLTKDEAVMRQEMREEVLGEVYYELFALEAQLRAEGRTAEAEAVRTANDRVRRGVRS